MTSLRYVLLPDGSLRAEEEPGLCAEFGRLRELALRVTEPGAAREVRIKMRQHVRGCPDCRGFFGRCEKQSRIQEDIDDEANQRG